MRCRRCARCRKPPHRYTRAELTLVPSVPKTAPPLSVDLRDLRLDTAVALLGRGERPPTGTPPAQYLQRLIDGLCDLSLRDPLTGLANRRQFQAVLEREIDRVTRSGEAALLLMLDIDHFKHVNDTYGHPAGDKVLQAVANTLARCVRPMDTLARYGGEEFAVVLPACQAAFGKAVAERIRRTIATTPVHIDTTTELNITISIGGAFALQWIRSTTPLWTDRADTSSIGPRPKDATAFASKNSPTAPSAQKKRECFLAPSTLPPDGAI